MSENTAGWFKTVLEQLWMAVTNPKSVYGPYFERRMSVGQAYVGYILPVAAIPAVAMLIGSLVFGYFGVRPSFGGALSSAIMMYAFQVVLATLLMVALALLAPLFGGVRDWPGAANLVAIGLLPAWVAGALWLWPAMGMASSAIGLYGVYVVSCGVTKLLNIPEDRRTAFILVTMAALAVVFALIGAISMQGLFSAASSKFSGMPSYPM